MLRPRVRRSGIDLAERADFDCADTILFMVTRITQVT
jgi:hypothetical protein